MKKNFHIMLIDDDDDDRMLFALALDMVNGSMQFTGLDNCITALQSLQAGVVPDIIFLDLNMPEMHGFDCLVRIRESSAYGHVPVIIYSTSGYCVDIEKAHQLGARGYLKKQSDLDDLSNKIKKFIAHLSTGNHDYLYDND